MFGKKGGIDLATFVGGIVRALTKGQQALAKSRMENITKHFEKDAEGIYQPNLMTFQVGKGQVLSVPKYVLSRVNNIGLDSAIVRCSAKLVDIEASDIECELSDHDSEVKYFVKPAGPSNKTFEIEMKFSKKQDCEADERLTEGLLGLVEVQPVEKQLEPTE